MLTWFQTRASWPGRVHDGRMVARSLLVAAAPAAAASSGADGSVSINGSSTCHSVVDHKPNDAARQPENRRQERKSLSSPPAIALAAQVLNAAPAKGRAAVGFVQPVDEDTESSEPGSRENEVHGVVHDVVQEGQEP